MASQKPGILAFFKVGKALASVRNCCATLNWLVDFCSNFTTSGGWLKFYGADNGQPVMSFDDSQLDTAIENHFTEELINRIASRVIEQFNIVGGPNTNLSVTRTGTTFTIDLYWE